MKVRADNEQFFEDTPPQPDARALTRLEHLVAELRGDVARVQQQLLEERELSQPPQPVARVAQ
jgi:hypothetical protein